MVMLIEAMTTDKSTLKTAGESESATREAKHGAEPRQQLT